MSFRPQRVKARRTRWKIASRRRGRVNLGLYWFNIHWSFALYVIKDILLGESIHIYVHMCVCPHECIVHTYILVRCLLAKLFFSVRLSLLMLRRCYRIYYANFGTQSPLPLLYKKVKLRRNSSRVGWAAPFSIVYLFYDVHVVDFYFIRPSCRLSIFF